MPSPTPTFLLDPELATLPPLATLRPPVDEVPDTATLPPLRVAVESRLGEGGMGVVDAVHDPLLDREIAVKRPRGPGGVAALLTEARTLAGLDHPRIVPVHALARGEDGLPALVMKRVSGRPLAEVPLRDVEVEVELVLQLCDALRLAHARGVLHRDVKPENVMVGELGELYLMDWGCACAPGTVVESPVGTPAFMAPEQATPHAVVDVRTDVYLLGALLYARIAGVPPHGDGALLTVLGRAARGERPPWPVGAPAGLVAIVDRACAADPADRPADVAAFSGALRGWLAHRDADRIAAAAARSAETMRVRIAADDPAADASFFEARFGFRAALERWPAQADAVDGLAALYARWAPWKLGRGEVSAVEALLGELPEPERWRAAIADRRRIDAEAHEAWATGSLRMGAADRRNLFVAMLVAGLVILLALAPFGLPTEATPQALVVTGVLGFVVPLGIVVAWRRRILAHRVSTGLAGALVVLTGITAYHRLLALWAGTPPEVVLLHDALVMVAGLTTLAFAVTPRFALTALPYLGAIAVILVDPRFASSAYGTAALGSLGVAVLVFRPSRRE